MHAFSAAPHLTCDEACLIQVLLHVQQGTLLRVHDSHGADATASPFAAWALGH